MKDRLAAYYHWNDAQCLQQAVSVALTKEIDLDEVERWSGAEGKLKVFRHIRHRLTRGES